MHLDISLKCFVQKRIERKQINVDEKHILRGHMSKSHFKGHYPSSQVTIV